MICCLFPTPSLYTRSLPSPSIITCVGVSPSWWMTWFFLYWQISTLRLMNSFSSKVRTFQTSFISHSRFCSNSGSIFVIKTVAYLIPKLRCLKFDAKIMLFFHISKFFQQNRTLICSIAKKCVSLHTIWIFFVFLLIKYIIRICHPYKIGPTRLIMPCWWASK